VRAVFLGTPDCAVPTLEALLDAGHEIPLVVTRPDRPVGRSARPKPPPVKQAALAHGLDVIQPHRIRGEEFQERLQAARPEVLVVLAYGKILPLAVLGIPSLGPVNVHFSLLPRYRGAAPVQWALANAEETTGVTTMHMSEGMDEGDILLSQEILIETGEHAPALLQRMSRIGASLLLRTLEGLGTGAIEPRPQDAADATHAPRLRREDGILDFTLRARKIEGRVRGFDPWPGVWAEKAGRRIRILECKAIVGSSRGDPAGHVKALEDEALVVVCGEDSLLAVHAVQPEGRRALTARDAVNGRQLAPGDRLEGKETTT